MLWPVIFLSKIADFCAKHVKWIAVICAFLTWINGLIDKLITTVMIQIKDAVLALDLSGFSDVTFSSLEWIGYVNAVFPLTEFIQMMIAFTTAWMIVIIVRWVKSFIPTIGN